MACTLANVSPPGCGIVSPGLGRIRAGASLLVSGSFSSSLVTSGIVAEVALRQNNLTAQLRRLVGDKIADAEKDGLKAFKFPSGPGVNPAENAIFQLEQKDSLASLDARERWAEVVGSPPTPRIEDLAARPKVVVCAASAAALREQLHGLHGGRPLVAIGLHSAQEVANLSETCNALLDGLFPDGHGGETASGNLLFTDPSGVLPQALGDPSGDTAWLGRLLWLVDGDGGPEPQIPTGVSDIAARGGNMAGRFGDALSMAFGARLNNHDAGTIVHEVDLDAAQVHWVAFLKETGPRLPGISGAARRLLATLAFGLVELGRGGRDAGRLPVSVVEVEALARFLVRRMANAYGSMTRTAETERKNELVRRMFVILAEGAMSKRDLYRRMGIGAALCEELLVEMDAGGLVQPADSGWERIKGATLPEPRHGQITRRA